MDERLQGSKADEARALLLEIARCRIAKHCLSSPNESHCCQSIVGVQTRDFVSFHVPEPWSGRLTAAPILFLSSNPSIDEWEEYPTFDWSDEQIVDFFNNRFSEGEKEWVRRGLYPRRRNGCYPTKWVRFFASARARASELLDVPRGHVRPGIDYVLSEVVHCKSRGEQGVREALRVCPGQYLNRTVSLSGASVVVCFGEHSAEAVCTTFGVPESVPDTNRMFGPLDIGGISRMFAFLPHPNARGVPKSFDAWIGTSGIDRLREAFE